MLQAMKTNPARRQTARGFSIPAPVGGLNARDPLTAMKPGDALILDNVFPEANYVALRRGYSSHATGVGASEVSTLFTYHAKDGSEKLFAAANLNIYDVTSAGVASSVYSTSITENRWQYINFSTTTRLFILAFNGADTPLKYDTTSSWTTLSITGSISSSANIINACGHKERVWLVERNTMNAWYLASQAISGAATKLPLQGVFNEGGSLVACGTLSMDAGAGIDDYLCFVTTNGEVAIYEGTNPASDFRLKGVWRINEPLGYRCLGRIGGDLIILTTGGVISLTKVLNLDRAQVERAAITAKIQDKFNADARNYRNNSGWQALIYPKGRYAVFNVPVVEGATQRQWIQNTITGGWCSFSGMNANCWALLDEHLYFGGNAGVVYKADTGYQDAGGVINWELKTAFSYFGSTGRSKFFKMIRPLILASGVPDIEIGINVDFDNAQPTGTLAAGSSTIGIWGPGSSWGTSVWGGTGLQIQSWNTVGKIGYAGAVRMKGQSNGIAVQVNGFDVIAEPGGLI